MWVNLSRWRGALRRWLAGVALATEREDAIVLDPEKLEVYALALELHAFAASKVPTLSRVLKDQLERASLMSF